MANTLLWDAFQEPLRKAGSPSVSHKEFREQEVSKKTQNEYQKPIPGAADAAYESISSDSGEKKETQDQRSKFSSQPDTSGVKEEEINLRPQTSREKVDTNKNIGSPTSFQVYNSLMEDLITKRNIKPEKFIVDDT
ncbi:Unknown protein, partial [Striga hermonthica]